MPAGALDAAGAVAAGAVLAAVTLVVAAAGALSGSAGPAGAGTAAAGVDDAAMAAQLFFSGAFAGWNGAAELFMLPVCNPAKTGQQLLTQSIACGDTHELEHLVGKQ